MLLARYSYAMGGRKTAQRLLLDRKDYRQAIRQRFLFSLSDRAVVLSPL